MTQQMRVWRITGTEHATEMCPAHPVPTNRGKTPQGRAVAIRCECGTWNTAQEDGDPRITCQRCTQHIASVTAK